MESQKGLNSRQKAFADYFIECGNATESAKKAGYSEKTARFIGAENLTKPNILGYIKQRTEPTEQKRIASADAVLQFFTSVMNGEEEGAKIPDRIYAGKEILKRDVDGKKLEIELLKLESQIKDNQPEESDIDDTLLEALNSAAADVWGDNEDNGVADG